MTDCIPPTESQALGPRQPLYSSFSLALALRGAGRALAKLRVVARWLSKDRRASPDGADRTPPRRIPGRLDPAQVAATAADLRAAIEGGARWIPSLTQPPADSSDDDDDDEEEEICHPNNQHLWYPLIRSLEARDARLFFDPRPAGSVPGLLGQADGLHRLYDVRENPWIVKADTETFACPCELTNETTQTWIMRLKITTKVIGLCKQQLHEQNWELFEKREEEVFAEVAGQSLEQLLDVLYSFIDATWSDVHISQQLTVFDAIVDVLFHIQDLCFSRSGEAAGIIHRMVNAFKGVIQRTSNDIGSSKESTIHAATSIFVQVLEFFCRNRDMVQSIVVSEDYNTSPFADMLDCLISKLQECAETNFREKGQRCIFVSNNICYVSQKNCPPGLLPPSLVSSLDSLIDDYIKSYLDEYWYPLMLSCLEGDSLKKSRRSSLNFFIKKFFSICDSQMTWKVQSVLKATLREKIVDLIVPKYVNFLNAPQESRGSLCPSMLKGMWPARSEKPVYAAAQLEQVIRELFER